MASFKILKPVGKGIPEKQQNYRDIILVQRSLNKLNHLLVGIPILKEDGSVGRNPDKSKTVAAIVSFQKNVAKMIRPDGRIDVNGKTAKTIDKALQQTPSTLNIESCKQTLNIKVVRIKQHTDTTLSRFKIEGKTSNMYFLEPGGPDSKVAGSDKRISVGRYKLKKYSSAKYPKAYELLNVPGRTKILIHSGNYHDDTLGCLLPGKSYTKLKDGNYMTTSSKSARDELFSEIEKYESTYIEISNSNLDK
ncbi:DUF5675 family protein [Vibrio nigripulchritudo]|uniref:DUF5675 family protein n=1 Tax=Vibrio nigripulchritudo TaxID=28173 RepID=UPI0003B20CB9|nr:DUF5675 family protein [Vibrio nigripulchritudo]CCN68937.1 conserved hypothetical protein [Vibrio nigripulchritudo SFn118]